MKSYSKKVLGKLKPKTLKQAIVMGAALPLVFGSVNAARINAKEQREINAIRVQMEQMQGRLNRLNAYKSRQKESEAFFKEVKEFMFKAGFIPRIQYKTPSDAKLRQNPVIDWVPLPSQKGPHKFEQKPVREIFRPSIDSDVSSSVLSHNDYKKYNLSRAIRKKTRRRA